MVQQNEEQAPSPEPQAPEQAAPQADGPEMVTLQRDKVEAMLTELQGARKAQSTFDRREENSKRTIDEMRLWSVVDEMDDDAKQGLRNMQRLNAHSAKQTAKAFGLTTLEQELLSGIPWTLHEQRAEEIAAQKGAAQSGSDSLLQELGASPERTASPQGSSADIDLGGLGGGGAAPQGAYANADQAQNAIDAALNAGDVAKARQIAASVGMHINP